MPACYCWTLCVAGFVFSTSSVFKVMYHDTLLHRLLCRSCRSFRNVSLGGPHIPLLGLIKKSYHGWLNMMTS